MIDDILVQANIYIYIQPDNSRLNEKYGLVSSIMYILFKKQITYKITYVQLYIQDLINIRFSIIVFQKSTFGVQHLMFVLFLPIV